MNILHHTFGVIVYSACPDCKHICVCRNKSLLSQEANCFSISNQAQPAANPFIWSTKRTLAFRKWKQQTHVQYNTIKLNSFMWWCISLIHNACTSGGQTFYTWHIDNMLVSSQTPHTPVHCYHFFCSMQYALRVVYTVHVSALCVYITIIFSTECTAAPVKCKVVTSSATMNTSQTWLWTVHMCKWMQIQYMSGIKHA